MNCPFCSVEETKVVDSRLVTGNKVRRRRECIECHSRFTTYEGVELAMPWIIKRDGRRDTFAEEKLRAGMQRALQKRPVGADKIEKVVEDVIARLRASGEREIKSQQLGEWIMEHLRQLDEVAYVRFASVYRSFQDVDAFHQEVNRLRAGMQNKITNNDSDNQQ